MQDSLPNKLQNILTKLNETKRSLDPSKLEPANLNWEAYLKTMPILSKQFQDIIDKISMLRYIVVYPTKPDSPDQRISTDALLCANDIPELNSENATCKQRYQEVIKELGFENSSAKERKGNLENQIADHNMVCESAKDMTNELIRKYGLTTPNTNYVPPTKPTFMSLLAMSNGSEFLPVPQHIASHQ